MAGKNQHDIWLGLGSNLGNREQNLMAAINGLKAGGCRLVRASAIYETEAWGYDSENLFCNQCIQMITRLDPVSLLTLISNIEQRMGRTSSSGGYTDRIIDIDILFYEDLVLRTPNLEIPHPRMETRLFVLAPLAEIAPGKVHPVSGQTVAGLKAALHGSGDTKEPGHMK